MLQFERKSPPWLIGSFWIHFRDRIQNLTHLNTSKMCFKILGPTQSNACAVHIFLIFCDSWNLIYLLKKIKIVEKVNSAKFWSTLGQTWSFWPQNQFKLTLNFLLIILIPSTVYWISDFFCISRYLVSHHIFGVSSFDFAPEGAGWLHHWTWNFYQSQSSSLGASCSLLMFSSLGASYSPPSGIFSIYFIVSSAHHIK